MNALFCLEPIDLVMGDMQHSVPRVTGEGWRFVDQNATVRQLKKYEAVSAVPSIYVTGIPLSGHPMSDEEGLRNEFEEFGAISDIYFVSPQSRDGNTPKSSRGASPSWSNRDDDGDGDDDAQQAQHSRVV
mmetsp:Transcript_3818/g.7768  ORF Transcript_3818/g.7768 Transcript_3818/m.7768 type:complete len:130 (-) Transcript_3818:34-423(-)